MLRLALLGAVTYWLVPFSANDRNVLCELVLGAKNEVVNSMQTNSETSR
jgi:hypothetical protein